MAGCYWSEGWSVEKPGEVLTVMRKGRRIGMDWWRMRAGTHEWLNPSLVTPSSRQDAHTFLSFSLQKRTGHARAGVRGKTDREKENGRGILHACVIEALRDFKKV